MYNPEYVPENHTHKLLCGFEMQTNQGFENGDKYLEMDKESKKKL